MKRLLLPILFSLAACASSDLAAIRVAYGASFTLAVGQSVALPDRGSLHYLGTANDSRCRPDVQCIWAGDAEARFQWRHGKASEDFSLHANAGERSRVLDGRRLTLKRLAYGEAPAATLTLE